MPADTDAADLYERDIVLWSDRQAELLRRLAGGERVDDQVDWRNLIEEIEWVGGSKRTAVESLLERGIEHLLKIQGWPDGPVAHWRREAPAFLIGARKRWAPSMAQLIDLAEIYDDALATLDAGASTSPPARPLPPTCPFTFADLIVPRPGRPDIDALLAKLSA